MRRLPTMMGAGLSALALLACVGVVGASAERLHRGGLNRGGLSREGLARQPLGTTCSVFDREPCLPYNCGVFSGPGCIPQIPFPLNQVPVLRVTGHVGPLPPLDRDNPADRLDQMGPLLSQCLEMPADNEVYSGMRVTLKLAFKRDGELLAPPHFTYVTHEAPPEAKDAYREAALDMVNRCNPLPITPSLGAAIAGRPFVIPIIETRKENAENSPAHMP